MNAYTATGPERLIMVDEIIRQIKQSQDEFYRGGREVVESPEQDERARQKQIRLSKVYEDDLPRT